MVQSESLGGAKYFVTFVDDYSRYTETTMLTDEIYMEQPEMFVETGQVEKFCKLFKPLFGLKKSGREWDKILDKHIRESRGKNDAADPCVYVFDRDQENRVIVIIYVDDMLLALKDIERLELFKSKLKSTFKMVYLGLVSNILHWEKKTW